MSRLPNIGSDDNTWGNILNNFLSQAHDPDGTLSHGALSSAGVEFTTNKGIADGYAPLDSSGKVPSSNLPASNDALSGLTDVNTSGAANNQALIYDSGTTKWVPGSPFVPLHSSLPLTPDTGNISVSGTVESSIVEANLLLERPYKLLIYYGVPQAVNGSFSNNYAAQIFSRWDYIVLGAGLEDPANGNNSSTATIIGLAKQLNPNLKIFGYVDLGVSTSNLSIGTMETQVTQWQTTGADGIFLDDAGYDYLVSRSRLNTMLDYIHGLNMSGFVNAWTPDDVMGSAVNATYNPSGTATHMGANDHYLLESFVVNSVSYAPSGYTSVFDIKFRADPAVGYRSTLGVKIMAIGSVDYSSYTTEQINKFFKMQEAAAMAYSLDAHGISAYQYSSAAPNSGVVLTFDFNENYPRFYNTATSYNLNGAWTEFSRPDAELVVHIDQPNTVFWYTDAETNKLEVLYFDTNDDLVGIGTNSPSARLHIQGTDSSKVTEIIQAAAGQSVDILELQNSGSGVLAKVDSLGSPTFNGPTVTMSGNVRGIASAITNGNTTLAITFATAQPDTNYAVLCTPNYSTTCFVTNLTVNGFTINFGTAAPGSSTVNWFVVR